VTDTSDLATRELSRSFIGLYPDEAARLLETRPVKEIIAFLESEPAAAAMVFTRLTPETAASVLEGTSDALARELLTAIDPAHAAAIAARLDKELRDRRLHVLPGAARKELDLLMAYPKGSAGSLMDPRATTFHPEATVRDALSRIRPQRQKRVHDIYLVDGESRLVGTVPVQDIALAKPSETLRDLVQGSPVAVQAMATQEEVVELLTQTRLPGLPVVDIEERLLGVIRHDALITAAREEASADIQTMVGASKEERALSKVSFAVRKRLPWLQINLATAFLAASVVGMFESTIARFTALAVLLPVVAGQSGNTGAQALAVTMRGLVLREIRLRHWMRISLKEVNVAVINGVAVALTTSIGVYIWSGSSGLALIIGLSMIISMIAAGLSGALIPMILTALGQDPAQSSSIILTTVTDVVGFFSFLGIATMLAGMLTGG
jgi:magnesium transporter